MAEAEVRDASRYLSATGACWIISIPFKVGMTRHAGHPYHHDIFRPTGFVCTTRTGGCGRWLRLIDARPPLAYEAGSIRDGIHIPKGKPSV